MILRQVCLPKNVVKRDLLWSDWTPYQHEEVTVKTLSTNMSTKMTFSFSLHVTEALHFNYIWNTQCHLWQSNFICYIAVTGNILTTCISTSGVTCYILNKSGTLDVNGNGLTISGTLNVVVIILFIHWSHDWETRTIPFPIITSCLLR